MLSINLSRLLQVDPVSFFSLQKPYLVVMSDVSKESIEECDVEVEACTSVESVNNQVVSKCSPRLYFLSSKK